jgi:hypothetical protein
VEAFAHGRFEVVDESVHDRDQVHGAAVELPVFVVLPSSPQLPHPGLEIRIPQTRNPPTEGLLVLVQVDELGFGFHGAAGLVEQLADLLGAQQVMESSFDCQDGRRSHRRC